MTGMRICRSEVTLLLKKKIGYSTAASGQQPQTLPQQPKKAALRPELKPTLPPSPAVATASEKAAPAPAAASASAPAAPSVKSTQGMSHEAEKPEAAAPRQHSIAAPSLAVPTDPASIASQQANLVKVETASRSASPAHVHDRQKVLPAGAMPGNVLQASTRQGVASAPKPSDAAPSAHSQGAQVTPQTCSSSKLHWLTLCRHMQLAQPCPYSTAQHAQHSRCLYTLCTTGTSWTADMCAHA